MNYETLSTGRGPYGLSGIRRVCERTCSISRNDNEDYATRRRHSEPR